MRTVSQLDAMLSPYLAVGTRSHGTSTLKMLNMVLPQLYGMGPWKALMTEVEFDCSAGYVALTPDYESIFKVLVNDSWLPVNSQAYEYMEAGPGIVGAGSSWLYGIIDEGYVSLMSDPPTAGIDELIFTSTSAFASGDTATVTYTDTDEGYAQVALPLNTITVAAIGATAIVAAADGGTDATTGEILTTITTVTSTAGLGLVTGLGLTLSQVSGTDATYIGTFRIHSIPSSTSVKIVKTYVALAGTLAAVTTPRLMPVSTIASVESIVYASLPARVTVKDADDVTYAILLAGDGVAQYRRYQVPQPPANTTEDWTLQALCKRAFIPITATTDLVFLDNINVLRHAFLAVIAEDNSDMDKAEGHWAKAKAILNQELAEARGGAKSHFNAQPWGASGPVRSLY